MALYGAVALATSVGGYRSALRDRAGNLAAAGTRDVSDDRPARRVVRAVGALEFRVSGRVGIATPRVGVRLARRIDCAGVSKRDESVGTYQPVRVSVPVPHYTADGSINI